MRAYSNVMELLVEERVKKQVDSLPTPEATSLDSKDLVAYALNRLPPLYATSQEGVEYQIRRARAKYGAQIDQTVHCALLAVQQAPQRQRTPLALPQVSTAHQQVLQQLRALLQHEAVTWDTLPAEIQEALSQLGKGTISSKPRDREDPTKIIWPEEKRLRQTIDQLALLKKKIADWSERLVTADLSDRIKPINTRKSAVAQTKPIPEGGNPADLRTLLAQLKQGVTIWNQWRADYPEIDPNLSNANLRDADLGGINFKRVNLSSAHLIEAQLAGACLVEANLSLAYLKQANLAGADLNCANLETASLSQANFDRANLQEALLRGAYFKAATLSHTNLRGADLRDANLEGADLRAADLTGANLKGADLRAADLSGANLDGANLNGAKLKWSNLTGTNLSNVQAAATNFSGARFTDACIENWTIDSTTRFNWTICEYVRLGNVARHRYPREGNFPQGEFSRLFEIRNTAIVS